MPPRIPTQQVPHDAVRHCAGIGPSTVPRSLLRVIARIVRRRRRQLLLVDHCETRVVPPLVERHRVLRADAAKDADDSLAVVLLPRRDNLLGSFGQHALGRLQPQPDPARNAASPTCCSVISPTAVMPRTSDSSGAGRVLLSKTRRTTSSPMSLHHRSPARGSTALRSIRRAR